MKRLAIAIGGLLIMFITGDMITSQKQKPVKIIPDGAYEMSTGQIETPEYIPEHKIRTGTGSNSEEFTSQELLDMIERAEQKGMENDPETEILKDELK